MQPNKIVMHYKDGRIIKGKTSDFFPDKSSFHIHTLESKTDRVELEELKALFFVKNMHGDKDHEYQYNDLIAGGGKKVSVRFADNETMIGYVLGYSPDRPGFLMTPADFKGNNERVYIVKSATKSIEFLTKEEKRRFHRAETDNLITFETIQGGDRLVESGIGRTLDISQGGFLMETNTPINAKHILLTTTDSNEQVIQIKGEVVYSRKKGHDIYHSGIHLIDTPEKIRHVVTEMVKAFLQTKMEYE